MTPNPENIILATVIVNKGIGSKVLQSARKHGLPGGTVLLGSGSAKNPFLRALALDDIRKEIVLLVTEETPGLKFLDSLCAEFKFHKPNHGMAFIVDVAAECVSKGLGGDGFKKTRGEEITMYKSVYVIVDKGKGEAAVEAATRAGAKGATIIGARGSGIHETQRFFNMDIEPEKELVLIVLKSELAEQVVSSVRDELDIDKPGNGIIFVQNVRQVYGLFE